jgi:deazaflavin-dependent oxidoreductase (nitroreductase family)
MTVNKRGARLDVRQRAGGRLLRLFNPLVRRLISAGMPTGAPNILLTVRGRRSGKPRTVPVGMVELDGRMFIQASYGEGGWVQNLRVAGEATLTEHDRRMPVQAVELPPDEAATILRRALEPYRRSRLLRALMGPRFRPPIGVLSRYRIRIDDTPEEYLAEARRHPLFELRRITSAPSR